MKTKNIRMLFIFQVLFYLCVIGCSAQVEPTTTTKININILNEDSQPVQGADVIATFCHIDKNKDVTFRNNTDIAGLFVASGKVVDSLMITAAKEGYYPIKFDRFLTRTEVDDKKISSINLPVLMRRVKCPIPLFAKRVRIEIPRQDQPIGFDLQVSDWVAPFGKGATSDLVFESHKEYLGLKYDEPVIEKIKKQNLLMTESELKRTYGKWRGNLRISFPNAGEGIAVVENDYCFYSKMRMPHLAYETGYVAVWKRDENTYSPQNAKNGIGYFLRTRVKTDKDRNIILSNYAKIIEDIVFDPRGRIEFGYVFNPVVNDRNLEFDTTSNKFGKLDVLEQIRQP